jgi:hypothetical protein
MSDSEQQENVQLASPPEEIVVPDSTTGVDDHLPAQITNKEFREIKETLSRLVGVVDALTTRFKESATAINQITDAINGLPQNQILIDAVCAEVIAISENSQNKIDDAVARQIAGSFIEYLPERPATLEESINTYAITLTFREDGVAERMYAKKYDEMLGDYVDADGKDDADGVVMLAINHYMNDHEIPPSPDVMYFRYSGDVATVSSNADSVQSFEQFMGTAMQSQGAVGNIKADVSVSREYTPGSELFTFQEAGDEDETPLTYTCKQNDPTDTQGVAWKTVDIDVNLAMYYISAIQAAGGVSGEEWYVTVS